MNEKIKKKKKKLGEIYPNNKKLKKTLRLSFSHTYKCLHTYLNYTMCVFVLYE